MKLKEYCRMTKTSFTEVGRRCGCTRNRISQIANEGEHSTPSFGLALKIEEATEGMVLRTNWYPSPKRTRK